VKAYPNLPGDDTASDYSAAEAVRTLSGNTEGTPGGDESTVDLLQNWLDGLKFFTRGFYSELPQLEMTMLTPGERKRLQGSGTRRYGYIDKVADTSNEYPQFWATQVYGGNGLSVNYQDTMKERLREIEVLRNVLVWLRMMDRVVFDLLLIASNDALRMANFYYASVRAAARSHVPGAMAVFQILEDFHRKQRNTTTGTPTQKKLGKHAKDVAEGKRDGEFYAKNESDTVTKGKRTVVDRSYPKGRGPKIEERETIDVTGMSGCNTTFDTNSVSMDSGK
jgi:hypothetical protein